MAYNYFLMGDMCPRVPYNTICRVNFKDGEGYKTEDMLLRSVDWSLMQCYFTTETGSIYSSDFKPYLRSMKDMTPAEEAYYFAINEEPIKCMDWLNKNHFDYRGLIEKDYAIEVDEEFYKNNKC